MSESVLNDSDESPILVNISEELVKECVRDAMKTMDMCKCELCYLNTCALALNMIKSKYVTTTKGFLLALLESSNNLEKQTDILVAVTKALMIVKKQPRHTINKLVD